MKQRTLPKDVHLMTRVKVLIQWFLLWERINLKWVRYLRSSKYKTKVKSSQRGREKLILSSKNNFFLFILPLFEWNFSNVCHVDPNRFPSKNSVNLGTNWSQREQNLVERVSVSSIRAANPLIYWSPKPLGNQVLNWFFLSQ